jgi:predicted TIM-barrel fold metal-dependent hydrolase
MQFAYRPTPAQMRAQNDQVLDAVNAFPHRLFGFVYLTPEYPRESLDELNRLVRDGPFLGVKLWVAEPASSPALDPLVDRARELKAVILQHTWRKTTGNLPGESTPEDLVELARRHPRANFLCAHVGGNWELGVRAIRPASNVFADLAGTDPSAGFTEMAVKELGAGRVLYGSDAGLRSFASQLGKVYGASLPDAAKQLILGQNLRRLLTPIAAAKGVRL